jgi:hypothetical protein
LTTTAARMAPLVAPLGGKLAKMIGRWRSQLGGDGGRAEFMQFANNMASGARAAGQFVVGKVGPMENATIYRSGNNYLVVDATNKMTSFVANARAGEGIVKVYEQLGGK